MLIQKYLRDSTQRIATACIALLPIVALSAGLSSTAQAAAVEPSVAENPTAAAPDAPALNSYVEVGGERHTLTGNQKNWNGAYVRGAWAQNEKNTWNYELVSARRFGDSGTYGSLGLTRVFNDDWYGSLALGTSSGADLFFPSSRVDVFIHRKFLEKKNLIVNLGFTNYQAKDEHRDRILHLGADYYFDNPWIISAEFIANNSSPGSVNANYGYLNATYGRDKEFFVTMRYGSGREAYQLLGDSQVISGFHSSVASISYRKWIRKDLGINVVGEYYANPQYTRRGVQFGVFKDF